MQLYCITLQKSDSTEYKLSVSPDYTLYEIKKEAQKIYNTSKQLDIQLNGLKINNLKQTISQFCISHQCTFNILEKHPKQNIKPKIYLNILWHHVSYTIPVNSDSLVSELKNKMMQMLGLQGCYCLTYKNLQINHSQPAINYLYSNKLSLFKLATANQENITPPSEKQNQEHLSNHIATINQFETQLSKNKNKILMRFNSLQQMSDDEDELSNDFYYSKKRYISIYQHFQQFSNTKNYFKPNLVQNITKFEVIESQAKETQSINSSNQDHPQLIHVSITIQNQQLTKMYTIQSHKNAVISTVIDKIANLERVPSLSVILIDLENNNVDRNDKAIAVSDGKNTCKLKYRLIRVYK